MLPGIVIIIITAMGRKREEELKRQLTIKILAGLWLTLAIVLLYLNVDSSIHLGETDDKLDARQHHLMDKPCPVTAADETLLFGGRYPAVQDWNLEQIIQYVEWTNSTSCRLAHDLGGHVHPEGVDGQKAVCMDPHVSPSSGNDGNCLVYSFGINYDWSFDEAMVKMGCQVYSFDPSMNNMKDHDHSPNIHFRNLGLSDRDEFLNDPATNKYNWTLRSLDRIYRDLGHRDRIIDYLKLDVEHSEWAALPQILKSGMMDKVRQLGVEIHLPNKGGLDEFRSRVAVLKSLEEYGMVRFDSKYNPWSLEWNVAVDYEGFLAYELAWWNSKIINRSELNVDDPVLQKPRKIPKKKRKLRIRNEAKYLVNET